MHIIKRIASVLTPILVFGCSGTALADADRAAMQSRLDSLCEAARELRLAPERAAAIDECIDKKLKPDRAACERFYRDYGAQAGSRAALYYDLPECVQAHEFRKEGGSSQR